MTLSACSSGASRCVTNNDCGAGYACIGNACTAIDNLTCSPTEPCPADQHCCGGLCGASTCCETRTDCPNGYCSKGRCQEGTRPGCPTEPCQSGVCQTATGLCVECVTKSDCTAPKICGPQNTCVDENTVCTAADCEAKGQICSPLEGCRPCLPNTSDCGDLVCAPSGTCVSCDTAHPCPGGLACIDGPAGNKVCNTADGTRCTKDSDCGALVCRQVGNDKLCKGCVNTVECGANRYCDIAKGLCVGNTPNCQNDATCGPPAKICESGLCVTGCSPGSCTQGMACSEATGRCFVVGGGNLDAGATCTSHSQCRSGACWEGNIQGTVARICSQACTQSDTCPAGSVCWELGAANMCVPIYLAFPPPYPAFDGPPGQTCTGDSDQNTSCKTGYCKGMGVQTTPRVCMEMCGRDLDCAAIPGIPSDSAFCVSGWPIGVDVNHSGWLDDNEIFGFTQLCHYGWGYIDHNLPCGTGSNGAVTPSDHDACKSGWCIQTPDADHSARCAEPCCTPADCGPGQPICKPIDVYDGVHADGDTDWGYQKICLWQEYNGDREIGAVCDTDSQCKSEICTAASSTGVKRCTHTCCNNDDCAGYSWAPVCRKAYAPGSPLADGNFDGVTKSLGRQIKIGGSTGKLAAAEQMLCLPP